MSQVSLQVDQSGHEIQGVLGQPLQVPICFDITKGAVLITLIPGRVYELSSDGIALFLLGDAGMPDVTATTGRFLGFIGSMVFKVEPDANYLSIISGLGGLFAGTRATVVELR